MLCISLALLSPQVGVPVHYDRAAAAAFIAKHWDDPARIRVSILGVTLYQADDCAFFASSVLWAGGLKQSPVWNADSSDTARLSSARLANPGPTKTVMLVDRLEKYLVSTGQATITPLDLSDARVPGAEVGDLIVYDWNHNGVMDHVSVVESAGATTRIAQHNLNLHHQSWNWSSEYGKPIAAAYSHPRAYLVHITG